MSNKNEWAEEQEHLQAVYDKLVAVQKSVQAEAISSAEDSRDFMQNVSTDIRINTSSASDSFESLIEVEAKNQQLAQLNHKRAWLEKQKSNIAMLIESPYFAKLSVQYPDEDELEEFYIGAAGFSDETHQQYVYDWRSPIANLYYENNLGQTSYQAPMGEVAVDLKNRRQIKAEKNKLLAFFDTNTAIEDPLLLEILDEKSTATLQDITSTIQREQNEIIRDTTSQVLLVEGIAGSGKTSTILQRIAFLLYRYRQDLEAEQVLLLSPNPMFSKYIEEVLPSLGEKNPRQMTYRVLLSGFGKQYNVTSLESQQQQETVSDTAQTMVDLENYVASLTVNDLAFRPLTRQSEEVISVQWMRQTMQRLPEDTSMSRRLKYLHEQLLQQLNVFIEAESKKNVWQDRLQNLSDEELMNLGATGQSGHEVNQKLVLNLVKKHYNKVRQKINQYAWLAIEEHYYLATGQQLLGTLSLNQATEMAYLNFLLIGGRLDQRLKFVIVDEVQDYSATQLYFLAKVFPTAHFTLVGDGYQAIFPQATPFNEIANIFESTGRKVERRRLLKSYRSSAPISQFMKHLTGGVASNLEIIHRPGKAPEIKEFPDQTAYLTYLKKQLAKTPADQRLVILTRNTQEAQQLYQALEEPTDLALIAGETKMNLATNRLLMPIYLAKGLEFDSVLVDNVSEEHYQSDFDLNLLYTASSRAMHELYLPYIGVPSHFLPID